MRVLPPVIQGGMGVAVSGWRLAQAVSRLGGLGVVSGTALAHVLSRRLQSGDPDGPMRRALATFPDAAMVERALGAHFIPGGKPQEAPFRTLPLPSHRPPPPLVELIVLAAFAEVSLAKQGHTNPVGINLLEKIQLPTLPSLYGAMLAGVDVVIMGAGIPRQIPGALDAFARGAAAEISLSVEGALPGETFPLRFDPAAFWGTTPPALQRPAFLAIVSSEPLARALARKANGRVDGFIIEAPSAGGHNAPPRGPLTLTSRGEPLYGERDTVDLVGMQALGLPFWLAGSCGRQGLLKSAQARGAAGIQVGTAFAFCEESGIDPELKRAALERSRAGEAHVFTDPLASPTGFPFKVLQAPGSLSEADVVAQRERLCDLGYLRQPFRRDDGSVGYRCPAEPEEDYVHKGGLAEATHGRLCVCNGLIATIGLGQRRGPGPAEPPLLTAGEDVTEVARFCPPGQTSYTAADVMRVLLADPEPSRGEASG